MLNIIGYWILLLVQRLTFSVFCTILLIARRATFGYVVDVRLVLCEGSRAPSEEEESDKFWCLLLS